MAALSRFPAMVANSREVAWAPPAGTGKLQGQAQLKDAALAPAVLQVLEATYDRLEVGGYVVVDDLHLYGVREALLRFRRARGITAPLLPVPLDYTSACSTTSSKSSDYHLTCINPVSTGYWVAV